jgi:serine/threonine-protein kinase HipA
MRDIEKWGEKTVENHRTVPGVQRKISLGWEKSANSDSRVTVVGALGGSHILKPPSPDFPEMPELEHITMRLAGDAGIETAACGLVPMSDGAVAYIVRRFDRLGKGKKIAAEDLCQLSELPTQSKYKSSCEKAGKIVRKYSTNPGDDALRYFELVLFSFLVGNSDMHLKNYSLLESKEGAISLSPAYDLLATQLLLDDPEESALTINGKKSNLNRNDFASLGRTLQIPEKVLNNVMERQINLQVKWQTEVQTSFLSEEMKHRFLTLIDSRIQKLARSPH